MGGQGLFCEHLDVFSETWPTSGTMRNGVAYVQQTRAHRTPDTVFSSLQLDESGLLRTPTASEVAGGMMDPAKAKAEGRTIRLSSQMVDLANPGQLLGTPRTAQGIKGDLRDPDVIGAPRSRLEDQIANLLPTPTCNDANNASNPPSQHERNTPPLAAITAYFPGDVLLPTPNTMDGMEPRDGEAMERQLRRGSDDPNASRRASMGNLREDILQTVDPELFTRGLLPTPKAADGMMHTPTTSGRPVEKSTHLGTIAMLQAGHLEHRRAEPKLPTPRATDGTKGGPNQRGSKGDAMLPSAVCAPNWGKYEPAIRRWEKVNGEAPAPTEPNTNGKHRLSARFTEWLMGLPAGWVTDVGISRNDELKALGNGVVPQQAIMALTAMKMATQSGGH